MPLISAVAGECGGKAGGLGALLRAGLPVPGGFVVPFAAYRDAVRELKDPDAARRAIESRPLDPAVAEELARALEELGDPPVAVRSSASDEDTGQVSAAGQHESFLAVRGTADVADAVRACWASLLAPRALAYRDATGHGRPSGGPAMAVIVQRQVDADVSGVMFTATGPSEETRIEASWGLGPSVVGGTVTPDAYRIAGDGSVEQTIASKRTRLDRQGGRLVARDVPAPDRDRPALDAATAVELAGLGTKIAEVRGGPQDVEWAIAGGRVWILQARSITAALPSRAPGEVQAALAGTPGSRGTVTGPARIVRGPGDFARVRPGDILVCPFTDPAWTPLLRVAAGVVTEVGGVLSHAAIVAREHGIPAVLGVEKATGRLRDGAAVTLDGTAGTITVIREEKGGGAARPPRPSRP
ncbi:PEP/pyruvate-binding domain-containing protein [Spongiactinospora rosea]|uniref:PEP/pyruvate-binding domain-containing protein n=1 Tax=Spongiactinospora rosea TaxID=2248750 RepID=UPI001CEDFC1D|nr:PEP/pyruvate-binding domain-containing protein [Spongiactinospora rosea]